MRRSRLLRRFQPVRVRATIAACMVVGVVLGATGLGVVHLLRRSLIHHVDGAATQQAQDVAALLQGHHTPTVLALMSYQDTDRASVVQVVDAAGRVLASTTNLKEQEPIAAVRPNPGAPPMRRTIAGISVDPKDPFRLVALTMDDESGRFTVYVATNLDFVNSSVGTVKRILLIGFPAIVALVGAMVWLLLGRALRPVESIRSEVEAISARALDRRVPVPPFEDEIARLARTMNAMLDRLEGSNDRQRQFVGDASHELKSPLAAARTRLEVALANHRTDWPATASSVVDELRNVETLVADLVFLARADEAHVQHRFDDVDIDDIVLEEAARVRGRGRVAVDTSGVTPVRARGDAGQLHRAIRNLVENAERHAVATVTLTVQPVAGGAHVMVADDGPGIPPADRDRIFGRFVRLDQARNQAHGGSGLGLAIARQVVTAHGGTVEVADSDGGARFAVFLPLALQAAPVRMGA